MKKSAKSIKETSEAIDSGRSSAADDREEVGTETRHRRCHEKGALHLENRLGLERRRRRASALETGHDSSGLFPAGTLGLHELCRSFLFPLSLASISFTE